MLHGTNALKPDRDQWIRQLEAVCGDCFANVPFDADAATKVGFIEAFRDEFGNRRASDRPFLAHLFGVPVGSTKVMESMGLDERLWWGVVDRQAIPGGLIAPSGGLLPDPDALAIEYRTMVELGALHALWAQAIKRDDQVLRERALDAARWNIEELQPDNAINRPWGLAVFVELAISTDDQQIEQTATLHAQTLLHNACINFGRPDLLSALILRDCAQQLRSAC
jgi:hypothetical protein